MKYLMVILLFFDVYQLNESFGQTACGLASADFNDDGYDDFITGGVQGDIRLFLNNHQEH